MNIVFMGTPDYSVKTLEALVDAGHNISAVFAQPDKPVGRKQILTPPPVKECALKHNLKVFQPKTLKNGEAEEIIKGFNPDVIVVVAYGKILPKEILQIPKFGCVNGHASLLPKYRGASPIQWCIVCGETETGVTIMQMDEGMDTGDILTQQKVKISDDDTGESLFEKLSDVSANLMVETLSLLEKGEITPIKQIEEATYAPIIKKDMALIDFSKSAEEICCGVRGYYSWPCAFFLLDGKRVKVLKAKVSEKTNKECGTIIEKENKLVIACGKGTSIEIIDVSPEGSKPMPTVNWLRGHKIEQDRV